MNGSDRPEINISRIPVKGPAGLLFVVGTVVIFFIAFPEMRWFAALSVAAGAIVALALFFAHRPKA